VLGQGGRHQQHRLPWKEPQERQQMPKQPVIKGMDFIKDNRTQGNGREGIE
jgi:hypothetical protein